MDVRSLTSQQTIRSLLNTETFFANSDSRLTITITITITILVKKNNSELT